jgi:hypothetical protein
MTLASECSRTGLATVRFPSPAERRVNAYKPFWTTKELGSDSLPGEYVVQAGKWLMLASSSSSTPRRPSRGTPNASNRPTAVGHEPHLQACWL